MYPIMVALAMDLSIKEVLKKFSNVSTYFHNCAENFKQILNTSFKIKLLTYKFHITKFLICYLILSPFSRHTLLTLQV